MKENIFENAVFGDKFRTRDGRMAIYHNRKLAREVGGGLTERFHLICDKIDYELSCLKDGRTSSFCDNPEDIVDKWEEPIDEKKLDKLAKEYLVGEDFEFVESIKNDCPKALTFGDIFESNEKCFKAGYRKAKQQ